VLIRTYAVTIRRAQGATLDQVVLHFDHTFPLDRGMIIRRAQGATLDQVVLYFDHMFPCDRGYAYVGASRVRNATGLSYFGCMRQSDWLPVGGEIELEHTSRGVLSESDEDVQSERADYDSE